MHNAARLPAVHVLLVLAVLTSGVCAPGVVAGTPTHPDVGSLADEEQGPTRGAAAGGGVEEGLRAVHRGEERLSAYVDKWRTFLRSLAKNRTGAWLLVLLLAVGGVLSLFLGWTLLNMFFLPGAALVGAAVGGIAAIELTIIFPGGEDWGGRALFGLAGLLAGAVFLGWTGRKARPLAWLLVVLGPFVVAAIFAAPLGHPGAIVGALLLVSGFALGFASMVWQRGAVIVGSALLGAIGLVFAWGIFCYVVGSDTVVGLCETVLEYPYFILASVLVLALIGADLQFILGPPPRQSM